MTGQINKLPDRLKDFHAKFTKRSDDVTNKLAASEEKASRAFDEADGLIASYDKMAEDLDAFARSISNSPLDLPSQNQSGQSSKG